MVFIGDTGVHIYCEGRPHGKNAQHCLQVFLRWFIPFDCFDIVCLRLLAGRRVLAGGWQRQVAFPHQQLGVVGKLGHLRPFLLLDAGYHAVKRGGSVVLSDFFFFIFENMIRIIFKLDDNCTFFVRIDDYMARVVIG